LQIVLDRVFRQDDVVAVEQLKPNGTDRQIGASFDRFERAISAVLMLAFSSEANF
jgi:hypothetical protein